MARALICDPKLVVCDEAVSALDLSTQAQVLNLLADLRDERGLGYLFIAHDIAVVQFLAQRVVVLYRGQVMESGPAAAVTENPKHPFTQALVAASPVPRPAEQAARRQARESLGVRTAAAAAPAPGGCPFRPALPAGHGPLPRPNGRRCGGWARPTSPATTPDPGPEPSRGTAYRPPPTHRRPTRTEHHHMPLAPWHAAMITPDRRLRRRPAAAQGVPAGRRATDAVAKATLCGPPPSASTRR